MAEACQMMGVDGSVGGWVGLGWRCVEESRDFPHGWMSLQSELVS